MRRTVSALDFITGRKNVEVCNIIHDVKLPNRIVNACGFVKAVLIRRLKLNKYLKSKGNSRFFRAREDCAQTIAIVLGWIPHTIEIDKSI